MNDERRWKSALFWRVISNAFVGAVLVAVMGALCALVISAIYMWLENGLNAALKIPPAPGFIALITGSMTAGLAMLGALLGAIIFAVATVRARPGGLFDPLRALVGRVLTGQIVGTIGFCSLYLCVEAARATASGQQFYLLASNDMGWILLGVPLLMCFGAIAGALSRRA